MLSRFSVLVVYLVAGLAASTAATPMIGQSSGHGDGMRPSRHSYAQKHDDGPYPHHQGHSSKACNVGKQYCCDTVNKASEMETGELLSIFSWADTFDATALFGKSCSPFFFAFGGGKCEAKPVCCTHSSVDGVFTAGCSNVDVDF